MPPKISGQLKARKVAALKAAHSDVTTTGSIGCKLQIGSGSDVPVVHTVELQD